MSSSRRQQRVTESGWLNTSVALTYRVTGSDDTVEVELSNYDRFTTGPAVNVLDRSMVCTVAPGIEACLACRSATSGDTGHETLLIVDPPGTVHTVTAADKVTQAEVLGRFCTRGNLAVTVSLPGEIFGSETVRPITCRFDPELPRFTYGPPHITQEGGLINCTGAGIPIQGRFSDKAVVTNSFGVERGHNDETDAMFARAEAAVTKAKGRWFDGYTFTGELPFTVPPASTPGRSPRATRSSDTRGLHGHGREHDLEAARCLLRRPRREARDQSRSWSRTSSRGAVAPNSRRGAAAATS